MATAQDGRSLADFADGLRGRRVAIVYSHRFGAPLDDYWYHRWKTNVIAMFSQAVEQCGAIPIFFSVEQWLGYCASPHGKVDFLVNLNAGNRSLDQWGIAPALGFWLGIPTFPCTAFTVMLGEAKDISKRVARDCGWNTPRGLGEQLSDECDVIRKPRTYGSSVGLERLKLRDLGDVENDDIVEEFVAGYDATIVTLFSALTGRLECQGAQAVIPDRVAPDEWIYDAFEKRNPGVRTQVEFQTCPVDAELASRAVDLTRIFGGKFVSRIDVRLKTRPSPSDPIRFDDCVFLEINPMPTIGPSNSVTEMAACLVERDAGSRHIAWICSLTPNRIERAAIYILACGLWVVSSR
ncbi:MAG: D-ala D-ala ligase C-terminus [Sphingomonadales bacterium]|jgi:hypothetical protein|nr:D-ala D-ala ligase C-terminus [Sphingomonadales bacterium]